MNADTNNLDTVDAKITATVVPEHYRLGFLPRHFGKLMLIVEHNVYDHLSRLATEYTGGYWEFVDLSNGGCFIYPTQKTVQIAAPNGFDGTVSGEVAGIIATLYTLSNLSFEYQDADCLAERFHQLRDFAIEHEQSHDILAAID